MALTQERVSTIAANVGIPGDLREWLDVVEKMGQLRRISGANKDPEIG
jgi:hypothetical protein